MDTGFGTVAENGEVQDVGVWLREHTKQVPIIILHLWVVVVHACLVVKGQIAQAEVHGYDWHYSQVTWLDNTYWGEVPFELDWSGYLELLGSWQCLAGASRQYLILSVIQEVCLVELEGLLWRISHVVIAWVIGYL